MTRRPSVIGENPLDILLSSVSETDERSIQKSADKNYILAKDKKEVQLEPATRAKERITVQISADIVERVKDAVYWTPGLTVANLTEGALEQAVVRLEKQRGELFPKRTADLKPGRPIK